MTTPSDYFKVALSGVPTSDMDLVTEMVFAHGAEGTAENLAFTQPNLTYDPVTVLTDTCAMDVFFSKPPSSLLWERLRSRWPQIQYSSSIEKHKDWLAEWKKGYVPFELTKGFWVVPSWLTPPTQASKVLQIDPGMAFGTGTHETTQLAADALIELPPFQSLLDVGTGTGILALLAEHLGYKNILALDIDPEARRVARENCIGNRAQNIEVSERQLEEVSEQFDVVVANIIDGVLIKLQKPLHKVLKPGGVLLLSGILVENEKDFLREFHAHGLKWQERRQRNEWVSWLLRSR